MLTLKVTPRSSLKNPSNGFLSWFSGSVFKQKEVGSFISIGRDSNQSICLDDPYLSRHHVRIENIKDKEGFVLKDMRSRNGTYLNGSRIDKAWIQNNDRIRIGNIEFIFSFKRFNYDWKIFNQSRNRAWQDQITHIPSMAQSEFPVLILGDSGTGKEHLAKMIHSHSSRSMGSYVSVNCSALTESLLESEFFGHIKGSYTGADRDRKGAFMEAHQGTLFLDEIGDLPLHLQPKLLRAIEYQEVKPVGSDKTLKADVRIVAATHQDLAQKVLDKTFRQDLYYRLNVLLLKPPPLRDRLEDFNSILEFICAKQGVRFSDSAKKKLKEHTWPGNIRELKNAVSRAKVLFPKEVVQPSSLRQILDPLYDISNTLLKSTEMLGELPLLKQMEKEMIIKVLTENHGNQKKTSEQLQMPRTTLREKLRSYQIISSNK